MPSAFLHPHPKGVLIAVRVTPKASRDAVQGVFGEELKVSLQAPPVEGEANKALIRFLAKTLGVAKGRLELLSGETSRSKRILVREMTLDEVEETLRRRDIFF